MKKIVLLLTLLNTALMAVADADLYEYYASTPVNYDFEVDGIYYAFGVDIYTEMYVKPDENMVSVTAGPRQEGSGSFGSSMCDYYSDDIVVPSSVSHNGVTYTVRNVRHHAFAYNDRLRSVVLPETIKVIGFGAFAYCGNLSSVELPSELSFIHEYAFYNCKSLTDMPMPDDVTDIGQYAFLGCDNYVFRIPEKLEWLYDCGANMELSYPEGIVLPNSVARIKDFPQVRRLAFGTNIPESAPGSYFPWISGTNVEIKISEEMEELVLPKSKFQMSATLRCPETLKRIILPAIDSLFVWNAGFSGIAWLKNPGEFVSMAHIPPAFVKTDASKTFGFYHCYDAELVVPAGSEEAYRNAPVWREFKTIRGDADIQRYLPGDTDDVPAIEQTATAEEEVRYFDMMGRPVAAPVPGRLYITSDGRKVVRM